MRKVTFLVSTAALAVAMPAWAQDQAAPAPDAAAQSAEDTATEDTGDIIVTATRREESLSSVPIAISAFSGQTLQNTGANDIRQLNQLAPSLLVSGATSEVSFTARVRGVGTVGENFGLESSVGLFVDGVYRSRTGVGLSELGDIERVEVLRGPQGTLFGKNSTAGLINITTRKPSFDFAAKGSATYGNYDYYRVDGSVTGGLTNSVAAKLDAVYQKRDGFTKNLTLGEKDSNDRDRYLLRGQLLFEPNSDVSLRLIGDYSHRDEICCAAPYLGPARNVTLDAQGNLVISPNTALINLNNQGANITAGAPFNRSVSTSPGFNYVSKGNDYGASGELNWNLGGVKLTAITAYRKFKNRQGQDFDFERLDLLHRTALRRKVELFTQELRFQGKLLDRIDWLVGGYYSDEKITTGDNPQFGTDADRFLPTLFGAAAPAFSSLPGLLNAMPLAGSGVTQADFRQKSRTYAFFTHNVIDVIPDKLSLTLGGRYTNERKDLTTAFASTPNNLCSALRNAPASALPAPFNTSSALLTAAINTACAAVNSPAGSGFSPATDPGAKFSDGEFTGTAVLSFKPVEDLLVYASYSKGFKAGGFNLDTAGLDPACNPAAGTAALQAACVAARARAANTSGNGRPEASDIRFTAEKVDAYEVGLKFKGKGFGVNVAGFYNLFDNFQLNAFNGTNFQVVTLQSCKDNLNGGDTDSNAATGACAAKRTRPGVLSKGVEIETFLKPARDLTVNLGVTYSDTKYRKNLTGANGAPLPTTFFQLPGRQISNAPKYVVTAGLGYTPELGGTGLTGLFYIDTRFQSDTNTGSDLDAEKIQDGFAVVNGRIGVRGPDEKWSVELFAQNLLNKKYQQIAADGPLAGGGTIRGVQSGDPTRAVANQLFIAFPGEPRTYGITVRGKF